MHGVSDITIIENTVIRLSGYRLKKGENIRKCINALFQKGYFKFYRRKINNEEPFSK